jgi:peptidoglycan/xylan/chitin deacetylase (PgdA/CDA1 family)
VRIGLRISVDTLRGACEALPRVLEALAQQRVLGTFLFSLGPDRSGRLLTGACREARAGRSRMDIARRHGLRSLSYGTLLPGPDIGRRCADMLRRVRDAGHEVGIHAWDRVGWLCGIESASAAWTAQQLDSACERFYLIFGIDPRTHGAPGCRTNAHALRLTQRLGFDYCSDTRGSHPYVPVHEAEIVACPQIPVTLPTLDELMATQADAEAARARLLALTASVPQDLRFAGHIWAMRVEDDRLCALNELLPAWREQGLEPCPLQDIHRSLDLESLPRHAVRASPRSGPAPAQMRQAEEFLAEGRGEAADRLHPAEIT